MRLYTKIGLNFVPLENGLVLTCAIQNKLHRILHLQFNYRRIFGALNDKQTASRFKNSHFSDWKINTFMLHNYGFVSSFLLSNGGFFSFLYCWNEIQTYFAFICFEKFQKFSDHNENSYFCVFQNPYLYASLSKVPTK